MTSDERTLISTLFDRLNQAGTQPKDAEADDYIRAKVLEQPAAPYLLVQSTLVMQQALAAAQTRIASLEKRLTEATRPSQEPAEFPLRRSQSFWSGATLSPTRTALRADAPASSAPACVGARLCSAVNSASRPEPRRWFSARCAIHGRWSRWGSASFSRHSEPDRTQPRTI